MALDTFTPAAASPAETLVLLHGGGQCRAHWRDVATRLAATGLRVVTADLRGHGDSGWSPSGSYTLADYVADLNLMIDDLVNDLTGPIVLVGHSHGGKVVLATAAARHPEVVGVVMVDAVPAMEPDWQANVFYRRTADGFADLEDASRALGELVGASLTPEGLARGPPDRGRPLDVAVGHQGPGARG